MSFKVDERYNAVVYKITSSKFMGGPDWSSFHDKMHTLLEEGKKNAIVDLSRVKFMNSSGIGVLIRAMTTMRAGGGDLRLTGVTNRIQSLLVMTKLINVFKTFDTVDAAVASYEESPAGA